MASLTPSPFLLMPGQAPRDPSWGMPSGALPDTAEEDYARQRAADEYERDLLQEARKRFAQVEEFEASWRDKFVSDMRFLSGGEEQWDAYVVHERRREPFPRPVLTMNLTTKFVTQVVNDHAQNRPTIVAKPVDNGADPHTAKVLKGLIRHIIYSSDGEAADDTAFWHAAAGGRGYMVVRTAYDDPWSFEQVITIDRVLNPLCIYVDPQARFTADYHSMRWAFEVERVDKDLFLQQYDVDAHDYTSWATQGDTWCSDTETLVANYWYKETQPIALRELRVPGPDGRPQKLTVYTPLPDAVGEGEEPDTPDQQRMQDAMRLLAQQGVYPLTPGLERFIDPRQPSQTRKALVELIYCCKINGHKLLEKRLWPGKYIPIIPVLGLELELDGKIDYQGIVRNLQDPARAYNFWTTTEAETIAQAPKAPYVGAVGQFRTQRRSWQEANMVPHAFLEYDPIMIGGQPAGPPQRQVFEPAIQAISLARAQAAQDLNAVSGIYPPALGEPSNEKSGRAIQNRKIQSQVGTAHFSVSAERAQRHLGRILVDLIPKIYVEPERVLRIIGDDGQEAMVMLHPEAQPGQPRPQGQRLPDGIDGLYNLQVGKYDVVLDTGPSYATKRDEQAQNLAQLAQAIPKFADIGADLIVASQDFEGAEQAARRLKKTLPPELLDDGDQSNQKPEDQVIVLQAQLRKLSGDAQALNAHAHQVEQQLQQLAQENQALQQKLQGKQGDLLLQAKEQREQEQMDMAKVALEKEQLALQRQKLQWDHEVQMGELALQAAQVALEQKRLELTSAPAQPTKEGS